MLEGMKIESAHGDGYIVEANGKRAYFEDFYEAVTWGEDELDRKENQDED